VDVAEVQLERPLQLSNRFVISPRNQQRASEVSVDDQRKRIQRDRPLALFDGFVETTKTDQKTVAQPMMSCGVIGVQLDRAPEFML